MKRLTFLLASLFLVLGLMAQPWGLSYGAPAPTKTPFVDGVYRALIIGNNDYNDPKGLWVDLKTPVKDAEAMAGMLRKRFGFESENILVMKNATRADILSSFSNLAKQSGENDSIFIYYAGHGFSDPDTKEAFWIPVDAVGKEDYTYVRNSTIKSKLTVIADHAKHVFLVSDSCFSGTLLREGHRGLKASEKTDHYYKKVAQKKSVQILAAGGLEYVDDNYKDTGHSPFTYFLLKQLELNPETYVSATELSLEVTKAVSKNVFQTPEKGVLHGAGDNNGEFFFTGAGKGEKKASADQSAGSTTTSEPETFDAESEMWALVKDSENIQDIEAFLNSFPQGRLAPVAKLKLEQLKRKPSRGSTEPSTQKKSAVIAKHTPDTGPDFKIALFPGRFKNHGKKGYGKALRVIAKTLDNAKAVGTVYTYYPLMMNKNVSMIEKEMDENILWTKGGMLSKSEPNLDAVCEQAKSYGANAVLMYYLNVLKGGSSMFAYLIDVEKKKQYKAGESGIEWRVDGHRVTNRLTKKVLMEFLSKHL